jgi:hypothetical protein
MRERESGRRRDSPNGVARGFPQLPFLLPVAMVTYLQATLTDDEYAPREINEPETNSRVFTR